jgi:endo-1,4-beta-xylanase
MEGDDRRQRFGDRSRQLHLMFFPGGLTNVAALCGSGMPGMQDELGNRIVDELGNLITGQDASQIVSIKDAAARRGLLFGIAYKPDNGLDTPTYRQLVLQEAGLLIPEVAMQAATYQNTRGVFDWTRTDAFLAIANGAGLQYSLPSGMIYPAGDMPWANTNPSGTIIPTLDGFGIPNINASNVYAEIDNIVNALKGKGLTFASINVSNELTDPNQTDGWRRHAWYNATNGPDWLVYAFQRAHVAWPSTPLYLCQDLTEQQGGSLVNGSTYNALLTAAFLKNVDTLIAAGAPIYGVGLQCHLQFAQKWDPLLFQNTLKALAAKISPVTGLPLLIKLDEIDVRTGNTGAYIPSNYSNAQYDFLVANQISQLLDVALPFVNGTYIGAWDLSDPYNSWGPNERPLIFDSSLNAKPAYYAAFREQLLWR